MTLPYHEHYNKRVVESGEPYNREVLHYLDGNFKKLVTGAIEGCLQERPAEPIRFVAEKIKDLGEKSASAQGQGATAGESTTSTLKSYELVFSGGIVTEVKPLTSFAQKSKKLQSLPVIQLVAPTSYDIDNTLRHMEASAHANQSGSTPPTVIVVEPPAYPTELIFLKGIPYLHDLSDKLQFQKRRGNGAAPLPSERQTYAEKSLELLRESVGDHVQDLETTMKEFVPSRDANNPSQEQEKHQPPQQRHLLLLPALQKNYLEPFDLLDQTLREAMRPYLGKPDDAQKADALDVVDLHFSEPPCILFISFNKEKHALTYARLLTAFYPYFERAQFRKMSQLCDDNVARIKTYSRDYYLNYWKDVHARREARDDARGVRHGLTRRKGGKKGDDGPTAPALTDSTKKKDGDAVPSPVKQDKNATAQSKTKKEAAAKRESRRQQEDTAFLEILRIIREEAAVTIQACFRGYLVRKNRPQSGEVFPEAAPLSLPPLSLAVPALLRKSMGELSATHGEIFGNYATTGMVNPKSVVIFHPRRFPIPAASEDDVDSEGEDWQEEEILLPSAVCMAPKPHFNPLRRLLEYHHVTGCTVLEDAIHIQRQCGGLSLLQRHAYELIRSSVLSLLYVAYTELFHRDLLAAGDKSFSHFVLSQHNAVVGWLNQAHFISKSFLSEQLRSKTNGNVTKDYNRQLTYPLSVYDDMTFQYEYLLVPLASAEGAAFREVPTFKRVCSYVYSTASVHKVLDWVRLVHNILDDHAGSPSSTEEEEGVQGAVKLNWWTFCPFPLVYLAKSPYALVPRKNFQTVQDRASFDELVVRDLPTLSAGAQSMEALVRLIMHTESPLPPSPLGNESQPSRGASVVDGVEKQQRRKSEERLGSATDKKESPSALSELLTQRGGSNLLDEDDYLKKMVTAEFLKHDSVPCFMPSSGDDYVPYTNFFDTATYTKVPSCKYLAAESVTKQHLQHPSAVPLEDSLHLVASQNTSSAIAVDLTQSPSTDLLTPSRSGRRRSEQREGWQHVIGRAASLVTSSMQTPLYSPYLSPSANRRNSANNLDTGSSASGAATTATQRQHQLGIVDEWIRTWKEVSAQVVKDAADKVALQLFRPWIMTAGDMDHLHRFEVFVEATLKQLKQKEIVVLAADQPQLMLYTVSAALLAQGIEQANATDVNVSPNVLPSTSVTTKPTATIDSLLRGRSDRLQFLRDFYILLDDAHSAVGVNVAECVEQVHSAIELVCGSGVLEDLDTVLERAEEEPKAALCRQHILAGVQLTEQYCWLVLLQALLSQPFAKQVLNYKQKVPLTSFVSFVENTGNVVAWMQTMDPWAKAKSDCPDEGHLRYSNGLRRWDCDDYICFGAI